MMTNFNIFGVLLTLAIIIGIILFVKQKTPPVIKKSKADRSKWYLRIYGGALLIGTILFYVLPIETETLVTYNEEEMQNLRSQHELFYQKLNNGEFEQVEGIVSKEQWEFPFDGTELRLHTNNDRVEIVAQKKKENDGLIEVVHYTTLNTMDRIDLTQLVPPPKVKLDDNVLHIEKPFIKLNIAEMKNEFTVTQFIGEDNYNNHSSSIIGGDILYFKIPSDVDIVYSAVQFIQN